MAVNSRSLLFVLLFFCLANVLFSQEDDDRFRHRFAWTNDDYALRYEVLIEKEEDRGYSVILREFTEDAFIYFSLSPGNYRLRVIPYDFRDIPGEGTGWKNFTVLAAVDVNSEPQMVMDDSPGQEEFIISTENALENASEDVSENAAENVTGENMTEAPKKHRDLFVALHAEVSGYSPSGIAYGGGLEFGGSINGWGFGINLMYAQDTEKYFFMEALAHVRFYFSRAKNNTGFFLQAEGGAVFFAFEELKITDSWSFAGGLRAGWRFPLGKRWYIEPSARGGYPYLYGGGVSAGIRF
jgi:hypothetical protein